jgi:hypothetical protein
MIECERIKKDVVLVLFKAKLGRVMDNLIDFNRYISIVTFCFKYLELSSPPK